MKTPNTNHRPSLFSKDRLSFIRALTLLGERELTKHANEQRMDKASQEAT
jgi:hypothetical protein